MSTALLILPRLQAMASPTSHGNLGRAVLALTHRNQPERQPSREPIPFPSRHQPFVPGRRKGPHSLRLVQARAAEAVTAPAPRGVLVRPQPQLAFYRRYTEAMLRRYLKLSMEAGRVSSLLGQDLFRGNVSHCAVTGFDDVVIFVEDVSKCMAKLDPVQRFLVRKIAMEGYTQGETAALRGLPLRSVIRRYTDGIDHLTRLFLERKLMQEMGDPDIEG